MYGVCASENRENEDEINTMEKGNRRAIKSNARGFLMGFSWLITAAVALSGE